MAYAMAPAPSTKHQDVALAIGSLLRNRLAGKPCKPFIAPTDVKLSDQDAVQPDILVVCQPGQVTSSHIEGAPQVVLEVLDAPSAVLDLHEKKRLYERSGVAEYYVVSPMQHFVTRYLNGPDGFDKGTVFGPDEMPVFAPLDGLEIPLREVFELPGAGAEKPEVKGPPRG